MKHFDSKVFNEEAFGKYVELVPKITQNELLKSRALVRNQAIRDAFTNQTGTFYAVLPMFGRLSGDALNYDGETDIQADTTTTFHRGVVAVGRAMAWTERDFSEDITGGVKFMDNVGNQVSEFWEDIDQETLLSILKGVFSMNATNGDKEFVESHTFDVTEKGEGAVGATTLNSAIQQASGDKKNKFSLVIMHSQVATNLENLQALEYMTYTDSNGIQRKLQLATWNGRVVLVDDGMPTEVITDSETQKETVVYTSYVLGEGAIDFEDVGAKVPYEMDRDPAKNGGEDTLYSRQRKVFAPYGISFTNKSVKTNSPTNEELENGANWEVVHNGGNGASRKTIDLKAIPLVRIVSKG